MTNKIIQPLCINYGCGKPVTFTRTKTSGEKRWRVHCSHCQKASYGLHPHAPGVTPFKTGKCSNTDSHLNFKCPVDWTGMPRWHNRRGLTDIDHIDGDSTNANHSNLDELCPICHRIKTHVKNENDNTKKTRYDNIHTRAIVEGLERQQARLDNIFETG